MTVVGFVIGAIALRVLRGRSIGAQIGALTCSSIVAVLAGAYAASRAMFISQHDLTALMVVLLAAGTVAIARRLRARIARRRREPRPRRRGPADRRRRRHRPGRAVRAQRARSSSLDLATELAATRDRLAEARERQRALEGSRRELVAWVSHDLRTPLAGHARDRRGTRGRHRQRSRHGRSVPADAARGGRSSRRLSSMTCSS